MRTPIAEGVAKQGRSAPMQFHRQGEAAETRAELGGAGFVQTPAHLVNGRGRTHGGAPHTGMITCPCWGNLPPTGTTAARG